MRLQFLQEYVFISLDMFKKIKQNKIEEELDAWLHCIASEEPEIIEKILEKYPEFLSIYEDIEKFRQNLEGVLSMFSDALKILDRNTVQYMVEEMQEELNSVRTVLKEQEMRMCEQKTKMQEREIEINQQNRKIKEQEQYIKELEEKLQKSGNIEH
ncbi:MAG: hypothetical protein UFG06_10275 [Lachnospiraceae bacterium]|nr:hypothetical protein [Lachnospiraceae bacterium]